MRRRALLTGVVAGTVGLAGCGESGDSSDRGNYGAPDSESSGGSRPDVDLPAGLTRTVETTFGPRRRLVLSTLPGERSPPGTKFTAGFLETATAESPPRVWTALTNVCDEERTLTLGTTPPFSGYEGRQITWHRSRDVGLVLLPDDDREYAHSDLAIPEEPQNATLGNRTVDNRSAPNATAVDAAEADAPEKCWRARTLLATRDRPNEVTLAPGESITGEYVLLWYHAMLSCPVRRGGYHFEDDREGLGLVVSTWERSLERPVSATFDRTVPGLPGYDATVWYHRIDADAAVYLSPDRERLGPPRDRVTVTFQNFSFGTLAVDPRDWGLYRLEDDGWQRVLDRRRADDPRPVPPGGGSRVTLRLGTEPGETEGDDPYVGNLEPGVYAVRHGTIGGVETEGRGPLRIENRRETGDGVTYAAVVVLGDPDERMGTRRGARGPARDDRTDDVPRDGSQKP